MGSEMHLIVYCSKLKLYRTINLSKVCKSQQIQVNRMSLVPLISAEFVQDSITFL